MYDKIFMIRNRNRNRFRLQLVRVGIYMGRNITPEIQSDSFALPSPWQTKKGKA